MGYAGAGQLPGGEQTLVARAGFADPDVHFEAGGVGGVEGGEGGAVAAGGKPACVAVGHYVERPAFYSDRQRLQQAQAVAADGGVGGRVAALDRLGGGPGCGAALRGGQRAQDGLHAVECPVQVDRGGTGRAQAGVGGLQCGVGCVVPQGEGDAEGGRGADQRGAAHLHVANGGGRIVEGVEAHENLLPGQAGLVEDDDLVAIPAQGGAVVGHGFPSARKSSGRRL